MFAFLQYIKQEKHMKDSEPVSFEPLYTSLLLQHEAFRSASKSDFRKGLSHSKFYQQLGCDVMDHKIMPISSLNILYLWKECYTKTYKPQ